MSTATYPDGRVVEFDESPDLVKYYEDEGATVTGTTAAVTFPRVFETDEDGVQVEQLPEVTAEQQAAEDDAERAAAERQAAADQAEAERLAAEQADAARLAAEQEAERLAAEQAAAEVEKSRRR